MKLPFSLHWGKPQKATEAQLKYQPIEAETMQLIESYSAQVIKMLHENIDASLDFDERATKILSDDLEGGRRKYTEEKKNIIANMYGAFLGKAIIQTQLGGSGKWVKYNDEVGILYNDNSDTIPLIALPINRAFKHIETGDEYSIYSYFLAIPATISAAPKK
jgi:hypothetical protein